MSTTVAPPETEASSKGGKKKLLIILVLVGALGAAGWFFFLKPSKAAEPKPGEVVLIEPIQVNLAGGHYLRLGLALQLTDKAHGADGSKAADAAITVFSGRPVAEVNKPEVREKLRHELDEELHHRYHGEVMGVYFTEYVTQ
ncbi:flagellar basal body-associated FliL family protein [Nocardioides sp. SYSU DS0651]|uniref:flagellar basal body-associated FliL family protein n=1 Tax=Nocardioides sp. SYSU DS0651 TaxID=3415955 RepID=UPI003F4BF958